MGYQESWLYIEPQHKFKKLIQAHLCVEQSATGEVAGRNPPATAEAALGQFPPLLGVRNRIPLCRRGIRRRAEMLRQACVIPVEEKGTAPTILVWRGWTSTVRPQRNAYETICRQHAHRMRAGLQDTLKWRIVYNERLERKQEKRLERQIHQQMLKEQESLMKD